MAKVLDDGVEIPLGCGVPSEHSNTSLLYNEYPLTIIVMRTLASIIDVLDFDQQRKPVALFSLMKTFQIHRLQRSASQGPIPGSSKFQFPQLLIVKTLNNAQVLKFHFFLF